MKVATEQSFDELFREHYARLVALGVAMSGSTEVARGARPGDHVAGAWAVETLVGYDRPGAWLRRVMTNLLIDHHRSQAAEKVALSRFRVVDTTAMDEFATWNDVVAPLPPRQRAIVTLHYGEDWSVDEVAEILGISSGTVKSALSKARRRLRKSLSEEANRE